MRYQDKTFSVVQSGKHDPRRDCTTMGHWPRTNQKGELVCWYCGKPCQSDGTDREPTP